MLHFQLVDGLGRVRRCGLAGGDASHGQVLRFQRLIPLPVCSLLPACSWICELSCCSCCHAFALPSPNTETLSSRNFLGMMSCHSIGKVSKQNKQERRSQDSKVLCDASCTGDCPRRDIQEEKGCYLIEGIVPFLSPVLGYLGFLRQVST